MPMGVRRPFRCQGATPADAARRASVLRVDGRPGRGIHLVQVLAAATGRGPGADRLPGAHFGGQARLQRQRLLRALAGQEIAFRVGEGSEIRLRAVQRAHFGPGFGQLGIEGERTLLQRERTFEPHARALEPHLAALQVQRVGLRVGALRRVRVAQKLEPELAHHRPGDLVLQREDVGHLAVVGLRPQLAAVDAITSPAWGPSPYQIRARPSLL